MERAAFWPNSAIRVVGRLDAAEGQPVRLHCPRCSASEPTIIPPGTMLLSRPVPVVRSLVQFPFPAVGHPGVGSQRHPPPPAPTRAPSPPSPRAVMPWRELHLRLAWARTVRAGPGADPADAVLAEDRGHRRRRAVDLVLVVGDLFGLRRPHPGRALRLPRCSSSPTAATAR